MDAQQYGQLFTDTMVSIHKTRLTRLFSFDSLRQFPNNFTESVLEPFHAIYRRTFINREEAIAGKAISPHTEDEQAGLPYGDPFHDLQTLLHANQDRQIAKIGDAHLVIRSTVLDEVVLEQELVMLVGTIEGFMCNSYKHLLWHDEDVLKGSQWSENGAEAQTAVSAKQLLELVDRSLCGARRCLESQIPGQNGVLFTEKELGRIADYTLDGIKRTVVEKAEGQKMSRDSFTKRINKLGRLMTRPQLGDEFLAVLDEANLLRNCILHNGSKATRDYEIKFGTRSSVATGMKIKLTPEFGELLYYLAQDVVSAIFWETEVKNDHFTGQRLLIADQGLKWSTAMTKPDNWIREKMREARVLDWRRD